MINFDESILDSVKKFLGLVPEYTEYDSQIITWINSAFVQLNMIGYGPDNTFEISDNSTKWSEYIPDPKYSQVKSYIEAYVRSRFDPPSSSFVLSADKESLDELLWRINILSEEDNDGR